MCDFFFSTYRYTDVNNSVNRLQTCHITQYGPAIFTFCTQ